MLRRVFASSACLAALSLLLAGCSSHTAGPNVKGQVLLDGKALADARVVFEGTGGAMTRTDSEGKFHLNGASPATTVRPGNYLVLITKYVDSKGKQPDLEDLEQLIASNQAKNLVPRKYSDLEVAPLTAEIKEGANDLKPFELKSK